MPGPIKSLLKDSCIDQAAGRRKCHRDSKHSIEKDELHLAVKDPATGGRRNYCRKCARPMLDKAQEELNEIHSKLYSN